MRVTPKCILPFLLALLTAGPLSAQEFRSIFDGKSLKGWKAMNMSYWSVRDGAITAESTPENPCKANQFIVWQGGDVEDFEVKVKFRAKGNGCNSGVQFRSKLRPDGLAVGYQADIYQSGSYLGGVCDEIHTRKGPELLTKNGYKTVIDASGKRTATALGPAAKMKPWPEWNEYHIIARGQHMILKINGTTSSELIDKEEQHFDLKGILGLQLRAGKPMTVQFKDIELKQFKQKGAPSHTTTGKTSTTGPAKGERRLFDGKSLKGWSAPDMSYWSVRDGAITAQSTKENPCKENQTLAWEGGTFADFDLRLSFRLLNNRGNSGVQFRSLVDKNGVGRGYQADIVPAGGYCGAIYDESTGRDMLAPNGEKIVIDASGKKHVVGRSKTVALKPGGDWNECHITTRGHHMIVRINGQVSSELIDSQSGEFDLSGIVGFQLRAGEPMTAQFKDIRLTPHP